MNKNPLLLIIIGLVCLVIGGAMMLTGGPASADPEQAAQCRQTLAERNAGDDMIAQCDETAFAAAMTATDADAAARAISAANNAETGGGMIAMFLIGLGLVLAAGGLFLRLGRRDRLHTA